MADLSLRPAGPGEMERVRRTYLAWGYGGGANEENFDRLEAHLAANG